jgi:hypothetical protein
MSNYSLDILGKLYKTFHSSQLQHFMKNDTMMFPSHEHVHPRSIMTADGLKEYLIDKIIDLCSHEKSQQYLV